MGYIFLLAGALIGSIGFFYIYQWLCRNNFEARVAQGDRRMAEDSQYRAEVLKLVKRIEDAMGRDKEEIDCPRKCGIEVWLPKIKERRSNDAPK